MDGKTEAETEPVRRPRFRYQGVAALNVFGALWTALGVGFVIFSFHIKVTGMERQNGAWFGGLLIGLVVIWSGVITVRGYFKRNREIVVTDEGITALAFGRTWRFIRWTEVSRIERIRCPTVTNWNTWRDGYEFVIRSSQNDEVWFVDKITNLTVLLTLLNRYVEQNHIALVAFDRGSDTRAKVRATRLDRGERKRLLREGYKSTLSSLTTQ